MKNITKCLDLIVGSFIATVIAIILAFIGLAITNEKAASIIILISLIFDVIAYVVQFIGLYHGRKANNKRFTIAFYIEIVVIIFAIVSILLAYIKSPDFILTIIFALITAVADIFCYLFSTTGCGEATSKVKKLSLTTACIYGLTFIFGLLSACFKNETVNKVFDILKNITNIVSIILFVILIFKTKKELHKK